MRLRNIKGANTIIENSKYIIIDPSIYKGKYQSLFKNDNPIHLEIGMGKGKFIVEKALKNPNINFIGIEKYDSVIVRAIELLDNLNIPNLKLIRGDARYLEDYFEKDISLIYLNFSDPWPKDRHEKRRLTHKNFLIRYEKAFKKDFKIIMKTDNRKLFEYSAQSFVDHNYKINKMSLDLHQDDYDNVVTEYELKFHNKGYPIYMIDVYKQNTND